MKLSVWNLEIDDHVFVNRSYGATTDLRFDFKMPFIRHNYKKKIVILVFSQTENKQILPKGKYTIFYWRSAYRFNMLAKLHLPFPLFAAKVTFDFINDGSPEQFGLDFALIVDDHNDQPVTNVVDT